MKPAARVPPVNRRPCRTGNAACTWVRRGLLDTCSHCLAKAGEQRPSTAKSVDLQLFYLMTAVSQDFERHWLARGGSAAA